MIHSPNSTAELLSVVSGLQEDIILRNSSHSTSTTSHDDQDNTSIYPVKLIILDSIAAPTRRDFGSGSSNSNSMIVAEDARDRVTAIFQIAQMLKQIGDELNVAIVVIDQIEHQRNSIVNNNNNKNSNIERHRNANHNNNRNNTNVLTTVKAALGTSWHHCVSTRILFEYCKDNNSHSSDHYNDHCITQQLNDSHNNHKNSRNQNRIALSNSSSIGTCSSLSQQVRKATVIKSNLVGCGRSYYEITPTGFSQWNF
mmetsp:Transcript_16175/g.24264  ORF Transcript_16175/g.24264 Transcript_16175/m.24264 type:complete len:255 (+) Transcript_16175:97-861(+)